MTTKRKSKPPAKATPHRAKRTAGAVEVTKRKPGNPTGVNQHTKDEEAGTLDNIQDSTKAPTGTSAAAGPVDPVRVLEAIASDEGAAPTARVQACKALLAYQRRTSDPDGKREATANLAADELTRRALALMAPTSKGN
ncbi:MAG: hypothetical protein WA733_12470 [Methylocystis sp.]